MRTVESGRHDPLGATLTPEGTNFALYSASATEVSLVLFDRPDGPPSAVIPLRGPTRRVWHAFVKGVGAGQLYGYRVKGEHRPEHGLRFNDAKLLLDPYAKAVTGKFRNTDNLLLAYDAGSAARDLTQDARDNTAVVPKGIVIDDAFDWQGDASPPAAAGVAVIYEVHLKGFTAHPSAGVQLPGRISASSRRSPTSPARHQRGRAAARARVLRRRLPDVARGSPTTGATTRSASSPPSPPTPPAGRRAARSAEFKTLVRELHRAGHQGHPRCRLQPHRRGQRAGPDPVASGESTTRRTTP